MTVRANTTLPWSRKHGIRSLLAIGLAWLWASAAPAQVYPLGSTGTMGLGSANGDFTVAQDDMRVKVPGGYVRINRDFDGKEWVFNRQWSGLGNPAYYKTKYASIGAFFTCDIVDGINSCDTTATASVAVAAFDEDLTISQARVPNDPNFGLDGEGKPLPDASTIEFIARKGVGFTRSSDGTTYVSSKYPRFIVRPQQVPVLPPSAGPDANPPAGKPGQGGLPTTMVKGFRWTDRSGEWIEYDNFGRITSYGDRNDLRVWMQYGSHGQIERVLDDNGRTVFTFLYAGNGSFITEVRDHTPLDGSIRRVSYQYDDKGRLRKVTDPLGHATSFDYGSLGDNSGVSTDAPTGVGSSTGGGSDSGSVVVVNTTFSIKKVTDAEGRVTQAFYGATGRVSRIVAPDGGVTTVQYGYDKLKKEFSTTTKSPATASGQKLETRHFDAEGRLVYREVNGKVLLTARGGRQSITYTDERGSSVTIDRNAFDEVTRKTNPDGSSIGIAYDSGSLDIKEVVDEAGVPTKLTYDQHGNLLSLREAADKPEEQVTEYEVDEYGRAKVIRRKGGTNADGGTDQDVELHLSYDENGNPIELIDGEGKTWKYDYDAMGNLAKAQDPLSHVWSYTYDAQGNRLSATDPNGLTSHYTYDNTDRLLTVTDARGASYHLEYDAVGRPYKITDPTGATLTQQYDQAGRLVSAVDALNQRVELAYDNMDRVVSLTDGEGNVTQFDYTDVEGLDKGSDLISKINYPTLQRLLRYNSRQGLTQLADVVDGQPRTTTASYDPRGLVTSTTNAYAKSQSTTYDAFGRPLQGTDELGHTVQLAYDHRGNLISATDELGHITRLEYDRRDKLVKETNAVGQSTTYTYDDAGRLKELMRANGAKLAFEFDAGGRLAHRKSYRANGSLELSDSFTWDDGNRLTGWSTNNATSTSSFDDAGRLLSETVTVDGVPMTRAYTYYANGQVQTFTGPDGATITYAYDASGELSRVDIPGEGSLSVTERTWSEPKTIVLPGGTVQEFERNALLSPTRLRVKDPNQAIRFDQQSTYGKLEELTSRTTQGERIDYTYDDAMRLRRAEPAGWGGTTETFELDAAGNRVSDNVVGETWLYDDANRLLQRGPVTYQYDAAGNLVKKTDASIAEPLRTTSYAYDAYNRLAEVRDGMDQIVSRYAYDPFGYRLSKEVTATGSANSNTVPGKRLFLQAEEGLLAEVAPSGDVIQSYGWQPEQFYGMSPLFLRKGSVYFYYESDPSGVPRQLTDKAGVVVWEAMTTWTFGSLVASGIEQPWRFPGQYFDAETGLDYNVARYYDPLTGRYISSDPSGLAGGLNSYAYADADPINLVDPYGLWASRPNTGSWIQDHTFGTLYLVTNGWEPSQSLVDFGAGFGDSMSFGITRKIREWGDIGTINYCSGAYSGGEWTATAIGLLIGAGEVNAAARAGKFASNAKGLPWRAYKTNWGAAGPRIRRALGISDRNIDLHHWLIERNSRLGRWVPDWIKNHPWNLNPVDKALHQDLHMMDPFSRTGLGAPPWARRAATEALWPAAGHAVNDLTNSEDCGCG